MSVPGTFKNRPAPPRRLPPDSIVAPALLAAGALVVEFWAVGECRCIVGREPVGAGGGYRWHLSISHESRYPSWDEIKTARYAIPTLADVPNMSQFLPKIEGRMEWTNFHDNCFHLYESVPDVDLVQA